ncbi:amino acid ABC transporter permease [Nocardia yunnanensis]|uniref:Amino acid ABC transporter permease n=1 Tax=Nocardia yunnanensis TaxID=2382165 RepID=A0A386ZE38_9NOCA|nr:amino acid ABC transporter permease [Nocardia yunnanensis]AYF75384.1 amino acid ABC transporter permease [Nocardia yunnanensis]
MSAADTTPALAERTVPQTQRPRLDAVPVRDYGQWIAAVITVVAAGGILWSLGKNPNIHWGVVGDYLARDLVFRGLWVTLWLTLAAMVIGVVGGTLVAVMRLSANRVLSGAAAVFVWFFRGTPLLVQLILWGNLGAIYPRLALGIPFTGITFFEARTSSVIGASVAALLALGLNEIAYASEIVRAGIQSVDAGQTEAAQSLGMSGPHIMRRVVLPQAMRVIVPPMGNETITMLKSTALVSVIAGHDLLTNLQDVYSQNYQVIPLLIVASIWYLALTSVLAVPQAWLERRFGKGHRVGEGGSGSLRRLVGFRGRAAR